MSSTNQRFILHTCNLKDVGDYPRGDALVPERTWTSEVQEGNPRQAVLALMPTIGTDVAVWVTDEDNNWLWGCCCHSQTQGRMEEYAKRPYALRHRAAVKPDDVKLSRAEFKRRLANHGGSVDRLWNDGEERRAFVKAVRSTDVVFQKASDSKAKPTYLRLSKGDAYYASADSTRLKMIIACVEAADKCTCGIPCKPIALEYRLNPC
jgi:hypothetical protein